MKEYIGKGDILEKFLKEGNENNLNLFRNDILNLKQIYRFI